VKFCPHLKRVEILFRVNITYKIYLINPKQKDNQLYRVIVQQIVKKKDFFAEEWEKLMLWFHSHRC